MRPLTNIPLILTTAALLLLTAACGPTARQQALLNRADSLMNNNPAAALRLTDSLLADGQGGSHWQSQLRLRRLNAINKLDTVFTAAHVVQAKTLADHFDRQGTPNERMLAHYLLGRTYADTGEAPMALQCYQEATEAADTTSTDCNFALLSRVYGQSASIFYQQGLYHDMLKYCDLSATYAWKSNDTLAALICHAKKASAYDQLMINDSTIACYTHAIELLRKYNYNKVAAGFSGVTANKLIEKGDLDSAIVFLHDYEMNSGYFNSVGDIVDGREIYYYWRGTYHLRKRQLDSAEYYLRKELKEGNDFNNQNAGSLGLAHLFQQRNMPDSAAKYYAYSYAMNDSVFAHKTAKEISQVKSMYDYRQQQETAHREKSRAESATIRFLNACILAIVLLIALTVTAFLYWLQYKKRKDELDKYQELLISMKNAQAELNTLHQLKNDHKNIIKGYESQIKALQKEELKKKHEELETLRQNETHLNEIIVKKEALILSLKSKLSVFERPIELPVDFNNDDNRLLLNSNETYKELLSMANLGKSLTNQHWKKVEFLILDLYPGFYKFMQTRRVNLNDYEYKLCLLTKLRIPGKACANFMKIDSSYVTKIRKKLHSKIFGGNGNSKDFDRMLWSINEDTIALTTE